MNTDPKPILNDVSDTALWVAAYRARETARPDALFHDPLAALLAGTRGQEIAKRMDQNSPYTQWVISIRTPMIDQMLERLLSQAKGGTLPTILNLGAGMDTRPYRMKLPKALRWIEVDLPHMIEKKSSILAAEVPGCQLERIALDLSRRVERQALFSKINAEASLVIVLTEGVTPYLDNVSVAELAKDLREQEQFQFWILDYLSADGVRYLNTPKRKAAMKNAPFLFAPGDWFKFYADLGWKTEEVKYLAEESLRMGRNIPSPWYAKVLSLFIGNRMKKLSGYGILERVPDAESNTPN